MRMQMTSQIDAGGNDPIFLMFHGYGNDESEMMRILDAVYAPTRAEDRKSTRLNSSHRL